MVLEVILVVVANLDNQQIHIADLKNTISHIITVAVIIKVLSIWKFIQKKKSNFKILKRNSINLALTNQKCQNMKWVNKMEGQCMVLTVVNSAKISHNYRKFNLELTKKRKNTNKLETTIITISALARVVTWITMRVEVHHAALVIWVNFQTVALLKCNKFNQVAVTQIK